MTTQTAPEQQIAEAATQAAAAQENFLFCEDCMFHIECHAGGDVTDPKGNVCSLRRNEAAIIAVPMRPASLHNVPVTWGQWVQAVRTAQDEAYEAKNAAELAEMKADRAEAVLSAVRHVRRGKAAQLAGIEQRIRDLSVRIQSATKSVMVRMGEGRVLNSLGELQGMGVDFDILCARREELSETIAELDAVLSEVDQ